MRRALPRKRTQQEVKLVENNSTGDDDKTGVSRVNEHENYIPCKRQKRDDSVKIRNSNINFRSWLESPSSSREEEYEQDCASSENLGSRGFFCGDEGECSYQSTSRNESHPRSQKCQERAREDNVQQPLRYRAMEDISKNPNLNEAMTEIIFKKPRYVALLNSEEIRPDLFKLVINSLLVILKAENRPTESNEIIMKTYKKLLQCHFPQFIKDLFLEVDIRALLSKILYIFKVMLQKMSNEVVSLLTTSLYWINRKKDKWNLSQDVLRDLEHVETLHESLLPKPQSKHDQNNEHPPNDFRKLSIVPTSEDFKLAQKPFLRANVTQKPFSDVEHYLDVQFRLLREDCFLPLRDSINGMRMLGRKMKSKKEVKQEISFVFNAVRILNPVCSRHGGVFAIQLDIRRCNLQNVKWDRWKRLKYGSLVCLSNDWFENELLFATVESRDDLKYGILDLRFESYEQEKMRQFIADETVFKMIENDEAFFEAYKHNLEALQRMTDDKFPFKTQIVHCSKEIEPPEYLMSLTSHSNAGSTAATEFISEDNEHSFISSMKCRSSFTLSSSEDESDDGSYSTTSTDSSSNTNDSCTQDQSFGNTNACLDFSSISDDYILQWMDFDISKVAALELNQWPTKEMLGLDESQYRACQLALTKRFALIQGPPGTGKTYVGLKIAQVLLDNIEALNDGKPSPILMVSYTNHALDQFLMGIKTREGIVRVGGQSREERLRDYNLRHLRERQRKSELEDRILKRERGTVWREKKDIERNTNLVQASQLLRESHKGVLSTSILAKFMEQSHLESLQKPPNDAKVDDDGKLLMWLGVERKYDESHSHSGTTYHNEDFRRMVDPRVFMEDEDEDAGEDGVFKGVSYAASIKKKPVICYPDQTKHPADLYKSIESNQKMERNEETSVSYLYSLVREDRWRLYRLWRYRLQQECQQSVYESEQEGYETALQKLYEIGQDESLAILENAKVIGTTTTSAAKHRDLLQRISPKIVIVEEAAEVLEAHILTSIPFGCEHLILIGDHQQLRPNCAVYELSKKYKLNISMFERLVNLGVPCVRLNIQHRMRPEIASLMKHIYNNLENHESVSDYEDVKGIQRNIFFLHHRFQESSGEDSHSYSNEYEVQFLAKLCRYILQQGYNPDDITVLTPYVAQMFVLKEGLCGEGENLKDIRISTIDNFQGEENDIILLSLVRSNNDNRAGFVNDINRACVALSRARKGLYVIGNFEVVTSKSEIWTKVVNDVRGKGCFGEALLLACQRHKTEIEIREPDDFTRKAPRGGCTERCNYRLGCGHSCTWSCHPYDELHLTFRCIEPCGKPILSCTNGHVCQNLCWQGCTVVCDQRMDKQLPCGHTKKNVRCASRIQDLQCDMRCEKTLECGHQCQARCGERCTRDCKELIKHSDWPCGHDVTAACSATPLFCRGPCGLLSCGHKCSGNCGECLQGRVHKRCTKKCGRTLVCSHPCTSSCSVACPPCRKPCQTTCTHSMCKKECGELCTPCSHDCEWKCKHLKCSRKCGEICNRPRCNKPCKSIVPKCKHKCRGLCSESCVCVKCHKEDIQEIFGTEDDVDVCFIRLKDCRHIFEVSGFDKYMDTRCDEENESEAINFKTCPICKTPIIRTMRYNNIAKQCFTDIEAVKKTILEEHKPASTTSQIQEKLRKYKENIPPKDDRHKRKCDILMKQIESKHSYELVMVENQVNLLVQCQELTNKLKNAMPKEFDKEIAQTFLSIYSVVKYLLTERIVGCNVQREIDEINVEITRQKLRFEVHNLVFELRAREIPIKPEHKEMLDKMADRLSKSERIEESEFDSLSKTVQEARTKYPIDPPTPEEKVAIIKAIGLSKGHWFKCPQGHVYAIGECGGAMEESRCPECNAVIGGTQHRLVEGNEVATEMDGARYAAWSEQANLENYVIVDEV